MPRVEHTCPVCGSTFARVGADATQARAHYCSPSCRSKATYDVEVMRAGIARHVIPLSERLWRRVEKSAGCWVWRGSVNDNGYGSIRVAGRRSKLARVHAVSYELTYGPIADGMSVLHRCDNPPCVRPDHLFLGTRGDNFADCLSKGRYDWDGHDRPIGTDHPNAKLTEQAVLQARTRYYAGQATSTALARELGVHDATARGFLRGRSWRHVGGLPADVAARAASTAEVRRQQRAARHAPTESARGH